MKTSQGLVVERLGKRVCWESTASRAKAHFSKTWADAWLVVDVAEGVEAADV